MLEGSVWCGPPVFAVGGRRATRRHRACGIIMIIIINPCTYSIYLLHYIEAQNYYLLIIEYT